MDSGIIRTTPLMPTLGECVIVLYGLQGAGKTSIGSELARSLKIPHIDADEEIQHYFQMTIEEITKTFGWPEFRGAERDFTEYRHGPSTPKPIVHSQGGGVFSNTQRPDYCIQTQRAAKRNGLLFYIQVDPDPHIGLPVQAMRVDKQKASYAQRPSQPDADGVIREKSTLEKLWGWHGERHPTLDHLADVRVYTGICDQPKVAAIIYERLPILIAQKEAGIKSVIYCKP